MPLQQLRGMSQADLRLYQRYTARRRFPGRRLELLLAQVAMVLAQVNGQKAALTDFLFDPPPEDDDDAPAASDPDAVASALNFTPRKRPPRKDETGDANNGEQPG